MTGHEGLRPRIAEGKTKIIWADGPGTVLIESKDDITAGDGARRDQIDGKAALATQTAANCFALLNRAGIPNHFLSREGDTTFRAKEVAMVPIELVARRVAFGSYLKRNPGVPAQSRFDVPLVEFYHKDDSQNDPLLLLDFERGMVQRHRASKPVGKELIDEVAAEEASSLLVNRWGELEAMTQATFEVLEAAWADQGVTLVDLKIECGMTPEGELMVADVIDNDSWRIWPGGDPDQMVGKQLYRDGRPLSYVADKYTWVAEVSNAFRGDA